MTTTLEVQRALLALGYDIGGSGADGDIGPATLGAIMKALRKLHSVPGATPIAVIPHEQQPPGDAPQDPGAAGVVPAEWMPWGKMRGIVVHWNAGTHKASALDREHYHVIIQGDASLVRGDKSITDNVSTSDGRYAAHTLNCNAGWIAVALCGMGGDDVRENPFNAGKWPITKESWDKLPRVLADLCRRYGITVTRESVLSHAEVQGTLGIKQRGKWDITRLPFDKSVVGARAVGDKFRAATQALLS